MFEESTYINMISKAFLGTVLTTGFGASFLSKDYLKCICQPNHMSSCCFYTKYFSMIKFDNVREQTEVLK